jgi:hypothetical protein
LCPIPRESASISQGWDLGVGILKNFSGWFIIQVGLINIMLSGQYLSLCCVAIIENLALGYA